MSLIDLFKAAFGLWEPQLYSALGQLDPKKGGISNVAVTGSGISGGVPGGLQLAPGTVGAGGSTSTASAENSVPGDTVIGF